MTQNFQQKDRLSEGFAYQLQPLCRYFEEINIEFSRLFKME
jgi:hypothetical protein